MDRIYFSRYLENLDSINLLKHLDIPVAKNIDYKLSIPGSKSISNRVLLIASLAEGTSKIYNLLDSIDTKVMRHALANLGVKIEKFPEYTLVKGVNGALQKYVEKINIENAGTAARFLTSVLNLGSGTYYLDGDQRMQQRPIADLINSLNSNGAQIESMHDNECLPLSITAKGLEGGEMRIKGHNSSQYISALMLGAPYAKKDTVIKIESSLVSKSYVDMTQSIMQAFGAESRYISENHIFVSNKSHYGSLNYFIESDLSSASYFGALAAITAGRIILNGVSKNSLQGDEYFLTLLQQMGCQVNWLDKKVEIIGPAELKALGSVDMHHISDVAPTLAVVCLFAKGETKILNVANMRIKECDRIKALYTELTKVGAKVQEFQDGLSIQGLGSKASKILKAANLETYNDHRMAMSLSLIGTKIPGIRIYNPKCVFKTFPTFFHLLFQTLLPPE